MQGIKGRQRHGGKVRPTVGSLFAGIGGLDLGLERAGFEVRWQVEIDDYCKAVLRKHWPGVKQYGDIREVRGYDLEPVDLICGGFPCEDISLASATGVGIIGKRSGLWSEFKRILGEVRPQWALIENVPALRSRGLALVLQDLDALGFDAEWHCIPASSLGAPHQRDRIFIVAYPAGMFRQVIIRGEPHRDIQADAIGPYSWLNADADGLGCDGRPGQSGAIGGGKSPYSDCEPSQPETRQVGGQATRSGESGRATQSDSTTRSTMPTLRATDADRGGRGDLIQCLRGNENQHFKMPTLTVKGNYNRKGLSMKSGDGLATALTRLPTLTARDWKSGGASMETLKKNARPLTETLTAIEKGAMPALTSNRWSGLQSHGANAVLGPINPEWAEWYMGFPIGYTELPPSDEPSSRK